MVKTIPCVNAYCSDSAFLVSFGTMETFTGVPASEGVAIGKAFVYSEGEDPEIPHYSITESDVSSEWSRLQKALREAQEEIKELQALADREMSREQAAIFQAHLLMLDDPDYHDQIQEHITKNLHNIEWIVWEVSREISQKLMMVEDPVLRERAVDIADVSRRIIKCLLPLEYSRSALAELDEDVILVAHDLMPSDMLTMNKAYVKGIALDEGSKTCHSAILARAFNIPAVLGLSDFSKTLKDGTLLALNGTLGIVVVNPNKQTLELQEGEGQKLFQQKKQLISLRKLPSETKDGFRITLKANIELPEEAETALQYGAQGIGLYRSEFLFIAPGKAASEEDQYRAYSQVLKSMGKLPVTIRTVDLGGDKVIPEMQLISERNPLLGWRAIRLSLANPELFKVQLRAILRASIYGNVRIMFPMISGIEELEQALALLNEARAECTKKKQAFAKRIETGVMIETPAAAMVTDILADRSDFFSIGTNDLIQYTLAVDRGNERVSYLSEPYHPAILRLLKRTIDAAHKKGIKAAMCGELAGDPSATALLLGMGLDDFSMSVSAIPRVKEIIRGTSMKSCKALAAKCLRGRSVAEIRAAAESWMAKAHT